MNQFSIVENHFIKLDQNDNWKFFEILWKFFEILGDFFETIENPLKNLLNILWKLFPWPRSNKWKPPEPSSTKHCRPEAVPAARILVTWARRRTEERRTFIWTTETSESRRPSPRRSATATNAFTGKCRCFTSSFSFCSEVLLFW